MYVGTIILQAHDQETLNRVYAAAIQAIKGHPGSPGVRWRAWCERAAAKTLYDLFRKIDDRWSLENRLLETHEGAVPADSRAVEELMRKR